MKKFIISCFLFLFFLPSVYAERTTETIVILRHGEKPLFGLGQLNCKGLNRGLLLPKVLVDKFGKPDYIYAPDPKDALFEGIGTFNYVRPLATITPLATQLNLPVNTHYGYNDNDALASELVSPAYHQSLVFVAWEHLKAYEMARKIMSLSGGNPWNIPFWNEWDYDSLYIISIDWKANPARVIFIHDYQKLDGQSGTCPTQYKQVAENKNETFVKTQRFIFIPEAEAQIPERGQLSCQGINRALRLTQRLNQTFNGIDRFVAADPVHTVSDENGNAHYYQRAVMTLEPATINAGKPLYTPYGYQDTAAIATYLLDDDFYGKTLAIAWPRKEMLDLVQTLYQAVGGNVLEIPTGLPDRDNMYVITVSRTRDTSKSSFAIVPENLNNQSTICPRSI